jgi:hypothetical protein
MLKLLEGVFYKELSHFSRGGEDHDRKTRSKEEIKKKKPGKPLASCTTAPSAEHARASNEDEPCDDARGAEPD